MSLCETHSTTPILAFASSSKFLKLNGMFWYFFFTCRCNNSQISLVVDLRTYHEEKIF